jgi:hypothetical protein
MQCQAPEQECPGESGGCSDGGLGVDTAIRRQDANDSVSYLVTSLQLAFCRMSYSILSTERLPWPDAGSRGRAPVSGMVEGLVGPRSIH